MGAGNLIIETEERLKWPTLNPANFATKCSQHTIPAVQLAVVATVTCYRLTTLTHNLTVDLTRNIICKFSAMFATS